MCYIPFKDDYFDIVYMVAVFQGIKDMCALTEIKRVLKPEGIFVITEFIIDPDYTLKSTTIRQCEKCRFLV